jgi:hypothetical protein
MTQVINLQKKRKAKARTDKEKKAAENRIKFGRTKAEKQTEKMKSEILSRHIDGHKIDDDGE